MKRKGEEETVGSWMPMEGEQRIWSSDLMDEMSYFGIIKGKNYVLNQKKLD